MLSGRVPSNRARRILDRKKWRGPDTVRPTLSSSAACKPDRRHKLLCTPPKVLRARARHEICSRPLLAAPRPEPWPSGPLRRDQWCRGTFCYVPSPESTHRGKTHPPFAFEKAGREPHDFRGTATTFHFSTSIRCET